MYTLTFVLNSNGLYYLFRKSLQRVVFVFIYVLRKGRIKFRRKKRVIDLENSIISVPIPFSSSLYQHYDPAMFSPDTQLYH